MKPEANRELIYFMSQEWQKTINNCNNNKVVRPCMSAGTKQTPAKHTGISIQTTNGGENLQ